MALLDDLTLTVPASDPDQSVHDLALVEEERGTIRDPDVKRIPRELARALIREVTERFAYVCSKEEKQRAREDEDLRFDRALLEDQWPEDIRRLRSGRLVDGKIVDARPMLVIPKLDQPIFQVIQEARKARLAINIKPKGAKASLKGANLRQGMIRAIEADSGAQNARMWGFDRAVKVGRGYYRVIVRYNNDTDDQLDIAIVRIKNQSGVYLDPDAIEPDFSDIRYAISVVDLSHDEYKQRYNKSALVDSDFPGDDAYKGVWITEKTIKVAEYWRVDFVKVPGSKRKRPKVHRWVCSGNDILESIPWPGRYIPYLCCVGREYNVNGDVCYKGMISNAKDAARGYNYMRSASVEMVGAAPKAPYLVDIAQIKGHEEEWRTLNVRNAPYLPFNRFSDDRKTDYGVPQRNFGEPAIEATTLEVMAFDRDIMAVTGRYEPSRGQLSGERSGKAIQALQQQGETATSGYLENFASYTLPHEGRIVLDLLKPIYREPGRIIRLLGDKATDERYVMLGTPFTPNGPNGLPQAVQPPPMSGAQRLLAKLGLAQPPQMPDGVEEYSLDDDGDYMVQVTVGRSYATEREATASVLESIMKAAPNLVPLVVDLWVENLDTPTSQQLVERLRKANPMLQGDAPLPPEVQAQMQAMQQQVAQLSATLQEAQQQITANETKIQAELAMKKLDTESRERIAALEAETELLKVRATMAGKEQLTLLEARIRELEAMGDFNRGLVEQEQDHDHAKAMADTTHRQALTKERMSTAGKAALAEAADRRAQAFEGLEPQSPVGPSAPADDPRYP